jgi:hypothetical protein
VVIKELFGRCNAACSADNYFAYAERGKSNEVNDYM